MNLTYTADAVVEVVAALIWKNNKFLICRRPANKARSLLWEFAGGKVEYNETKQHALIRECKEELSIIISVGDIFAENTYKYDDITINLTLFNASIISGEPKRNEHSDIRWITIREIPQYEFCAADIPILNKLAKQKE